MKTLVKEIVSYEAIDGSVFDSSDACREYEDRLPKHLRWCLQNKIGHAQLVREGVWCVGYNLWHTHTEYDPPAFLRAGGDREVSTSSMFIKGYVRGSFSDAVSWAVNQQGWFNEPGNFIRPITVIDL